MLFYDRTLWDKLAGRFGISPVAKRLMQHRHKRVRLFGERKRYKTMGRHRSARDFAHTPKGYFGRIKLVWDPGMAPPEPIRSMAEDWVKRDIRINLAGLRSPETLVVHHVKLSHDWEGSSVSVYGIKGSDCFHCAYAETTTWVRMSYDAGIDANA